MTECECDSIARSFQLAASGVAEHFRNPGVAVSAKGSIAWFPPCGSNKLPADVEIQLSQESAKAVKSSLGNVMRIIFEGRNRT